MTLYCPTCGYNLTGLADNRCPECGKAFDPRQVGLQQASRSRVDLPDDVTMVAVAAWLFVLPMLYWALAAGLAWLWGIDAVMLLVLLLLAAPFMLMVARRLCRRIAFTRALADNRPREWVVAGGSAMRLSTALWAMQLFAALGPVVFVVVLAG